MLLFVLNLKIAAATWFLSFLCVKACSPLDIKESVTSRWRENKNPPYIRVTQCHRRWKRYTVTTNITMYCIIHQIERICKRKIMYLIMKHIRWWKEKHGSDQREIIIKPHFIKAIVHYPTLTRHFNTSSGNYQQQPNTSGHSVKRQVKERSSKNIDHSNVAVDVTARASWRCKGAARIIKADSWLSRY